MAELSPTSADTSPDAPLLIFKVGVLGALPLHAMSVLADTYDATYFSSDETRLEIMERRESRGMSPEKAQDVDTGRIRDLLMLQATSALRRDEDVVLDMFFNTAKSRRIPLKVAQETGAKTIALWMQTPAPIAMRRTTEWTRRDAFVVPVSRWEVPPPTVTERMAEHVEKPSRKREGLDHVFTLYGIRSNTDAVIEQFEERLEQNGLTDRYEDAE